MSIAHTLDKTMIRGDNVTGVGYSVTGGSGGYKNRLIARDQLYLKINGPTDSGYLNLLNRTQRVQVLSRVLTQDVPTLSNCHRNAGYGDEVALYKQSGVDTPGYSGGIFPTTVGLGAFGMEITPGPGAYGTTTSAIVLCNSASGTFNYTTNDCAAMEFNKDGHIYIYENQVIKAVGSWVQGDWGYVEIRQGIIRYWHVTAESVVKGVPQLLRTSRSPVAFQLSPRGMIYEATDVEIRFSLWYATAEWSSYVQVYGVLAGEFQDLKNVQSIESLGERTLTKDKKESYTYFTDEKNLLNLGLDLEWRLSSEYQEFRDFALWHDQSEPFIFIDNARPVLLLQSSPGLAANEMFAHFSSAWSDNPLGAGLFGARADIRQLPDPPFVLPTA